MKSSVIEKVVRWMALLMLPPIAAWSVIDRFLDPARLRAECWATLTVSTPAMACSPGMFLIGVALLLGLSQLILVIPLMAWIGVMLRAGRTDAKRVRRRGLIAYAIATLIAGMIAVITRVTLRDFLLEFWVPIGVVIALSLLIVTMPAWNDSPSRVAPKV